MAQVHDATAGSGKTGRLSSIGTSALQLTSTSFHAYNGVEIVASPANGAGIIYVGYSSAITANSADGTDGFPLVAGARKVFSVDDANKLYVIGSTTSLACWWEAA